MHQNRSNWVAFVLSFQRTIMTKRTKNEDNIINPLAYIKASDNPHPGVIKICNYSRDVRPLIDWLFVLRLMKHRFHLMLVRCWFVILTMKFKQWINILKLVTYKADLALTRQKYSLWVIFKSSFWIKNGDNCLLAVL